MENANEQELETETTAVKIQPAMALTSQKAASGPKIQSKVGVATSSSSPA